MTRARAEAAKNTSSAAESKGEHLMNGAVKKTAAALFAILFLIVSAASSSAWDAVSEVRRLNKEAPSLDGFAGAEALVWLRNSDFRMLTDGTMEHTRRVIVMMGEKIPDSWKTMKFAIPSDGTLTIEDAAWYNPMTGFKEGSLYVSDETLSGGAAGKVVSTPDDAVGRVVVLSIRETHEKHYGVDATIPMAGSLPIWEQNVSVEAPAGRELYWLGKDIKDPVITKESGTETHRWTIMNQEPWNGDGFVVYLRPSLTFSTKKGINQSLRDMAALEQSVPTLPIPSSAAVKGDKTRAGIKLMEWMAQPERTLRHYPKNMVRDADKLPAEGPWTQWEQTLILNKQLRKLGWESSVWWQPVGDVDKDSPASSELWSAPVLQLNGKDGKSTVYRAGQTSEFGVTAPSVAGSVIYSLKDGEFITKNVTVGSPADHKLSLLWILKLNDVGRASGTLTITASGGWTTLFSDGNMPSKANLTEFLKSKVNFAIPGMALTPTSVSPTKTGYKLDFAVECAPGLILAGNLLLRLPGGVPTRVGEMINKNSEYTLRFPFILEQKVRMDMPGGYKIIQVPTVKKLGEGSKAVLKESITHWPKKAQLLADSLWVVKTIHIDKALGGVMREELNACLRWPILDIPFRK